MTLILAGAALCGYPYFVSNLWAELGIGAALLALPFIWRV